MSVADSAILVIAIYVDDGLKLSNRPNLMKECLTHLKSKFEITTGKSDVFVRLQIARDKLNSKLYINQESYIRRFLEQYELDGAKFVPTPMDSNLKLDKNGANGVISKSVEVPYRQLLGKL